MVKLLLMILNSELTGVFMIKRSYQSIFEGEVADVFDGKALEERLVVAGITDALVARKLLTPSTKETDDVEVVL